MQTKVIRIICFLLNSKSNLVRTWHGVCDRTILDHEPVKILAAAILMNDNPTFH